MLYKKINIDLIVPADEAEEVVAGLNTALDQLEERHTLFGGQIEAVAIEHRGARKRSALSHTLAAGEKVTVAIKAARESVSSALRSVI
jgi:hemin uptake protein HemP